MGKNLAFNLQLEILARYQLPVDPVEPTSRTHARPCYCTAAAAIGTSPDLNKAEIAALSYARARCGGYGTACTRPPYAHRVAETSYAKCGDLSLAYQVFGDGPVELVFVGPMVFHVELFWAMPEFKAFFDQLATF
jgi:hypothetical protein